MTNKHKRAKSFLPIAIEKYVDGGYTLARLGVDVHSTTPVKLVQP
jgi:hypothetical protein